MLIAAILAPFVLLVVFFILGAFFVAAYERGDSFMMKFWGAILGSILVILLGSFWLYRHIDVTMN